MIAVIYELVLRKYKIFLGFLLIAGASLVFAANQKPEFPLYLYILFCFYWNSFLKLIGAGTRWKLMWSLPLTDRDILAGLALGNLILGWSMNILLFLIVRVWIPIPLFALLFPCALTLITDPFVISLNFVNGEKMKLIVSIAWMGLVYGLPFVFRGASIEKLVLSYIEWPLFLKILPFVGIYLAGIAVSGFFYLYFKRTYEVAEG